MRNFKLFQDFGVTALFGTLVIVGSFVAIGLGIATEQLDFGQLLPLIAVWVGAIIAAYFTIKARR